MTELKLILSSLIYAFMLETTKVHRKLPASSKEGPISHAEFARLIGMKYIIATWSAPYAMLDTYMLYRLQVKKHLEIRFAEYHLHI
jgi:hypothetical protein